MKHGRTVIFHIDVNSAFLSWEAVYRLHHLGGKEDLRNMVSAVGGDMAMRHGIILAKSIPAKKYQIKTGETILEARQKCPGLFLVPPNYGLYEKCSNRNMQNLTGERMMMEYFIQSFGNISIGQAVIVISAIVFLVMVYKKVTTYISKKELDEKEKNDQIQEVIDQAKQYPVWHQQSIDIRENLNTLISNLDKKIDKLQCSSDQGMG